ncbi:MAG: hypothetical protein HKN92_04825 [Chitinophagales bacterium]|nr:hypothetical protein [Chitinophagales bacterium]
MKKFRTLLLILPFSFFYFSCSESDTSLRGRVVSSELILSLDKNGVENKMNEFDPAVKFLFPPRLGVDIYKVIYETVSFDNSTTTASGIVVIPNDGGSYPIASYQHGTIVVKEEAPSRLVGEFVVGLGISTDGYITVMSDYLGLGDSEGLHPYVHASSEASACLDMLRASKNLLSDLDIPNNGQLFLFGYSQGGHSTAALQKEIEEMHSSEFAITASAPMSGPYDLSGTMADVFQDTSTTSAPYYLPYTLLSYNMVYDLYTNDEIFKAPYNNTMPALFNGMNSSSTISGSMPSAPIDIVNENLVNDFNSDPDHPLHQKLEENDLIHWIPQAPTRIYYCEDDEQVDKMNSIIAYDNFINLGANNVEIKNIGAGLGHVDCAIPTFSNAKAWFDSLKIQ